MNKRTFWLIGFITVALLGTIAIQVVLFSNAVEVRKSRLRSEIAEAIRNAGEQLEGIDAMRVLNSDTDFKPWLQSQIPEVFSVVDSNFMQAEPMVSHDTEIVMENTGILSISTMDGQRFDPEFMDSTGYYTYQLQADTTYYSSGGPYRIETRQRGSGRRDMDGRIRVYQGQLRRLEERVLMMDTVLQSFVRSSVQDWVPIEDRFDRAEVDSVIRSELLQKDIDIPYSYAIKEGDFLTNLKSDDFQPDQVDFKVPIFGNTLWGAKRYLLVDVPDSDTYVYQSMWNMVLLSILFTLGVIATFWATLRQMLKQRKINAIKNSFINNMTHEFKTPLATINLAIDALNSPKVKDDDEKRAHYTRIIRKENARMHNQVEQVLQMSLLDKDEMDLSTEAIHVSEWLDDAIAHMTLSVEERKGEIHTSIDEDLIVKVDRHHMTNVIINILDNAMKYSMEEPHIYVTAQASKGMVQISIKDYGIGMTKEVREHVFDRFYRAETGNVHTVTGHGLGLAYAKEIIDRHGGEIKVKSTPGKGSTFIITLALSEEQT